MKQMLIVEEDEYKQLVAKVGELKQVVDGLLGDKRKLKVADELQGMWLRKRVARRFFDTKDSPLPASTFNDWVRKWLASGELDVEKGNCRFIGDEFLIHRDFITLERKGKMR